jgi:hypothetical protein
VSTDGPHCSDLGPRIVAKCIGHCAPRRAACLMVPLVPEIVRRRRKVAEERNKPAFEALKVLKQKA